MSTDTEEFLAHYGVLGMKWGVRKDRKREEKADKAWQKDIYSNNGALRVHNAMADIVNSSGALDRLNADPTYKNVDVFRLPNASLTKAYLHEFEQIQSSAAREAVRQVHGVSPSGGYTATVDTTNPKQYTVKVKKSVASHSNAAPLLPELIFELDQDATGRILGVAKIKEDGDDILEQSDEVEEFLAHYGVLGMKWGIRKDARVGPRRLGERTDTGGKRNASTSMFGDAELKQVIDRMKLEQEYARITTPPPSKGKDWVSKTIPTLATLAVTATASHVIGRELNKRLPKGSAQQTQEALKEANKTIERLLTER
jgi:hypothetical protein